MVELLAVQVAPGLLATYVGTGQRAGGDWVQPGIAVSASAIPTASAELEA